MGCKGTKKLLNGSKKTTKFWFERKYLYFFLELK